METKDETTNKTTGGSGQVEPIVSVHYYAWISSAGERDFYKNKNTLFAGMVKNVPDKYKPLPDGANGRQYCTIIQETH